MNVVHIVATCVVFAIVVYMVVQARKFRYVTIDGRSYRVLNTPHAEASAAMLAKLESSAKKLLVACESVVPNDARFENIRKRWSGTIREIDDTDTSIAYSVGKSDVYMCVCDRTGAIAHFNDTMFVLLHELSHIANETYGHNDDFWKTFKFVLEVAERAGVYTFQDYGRQSVNVCGKEIETTPLACVKDGECFSELGPIRPS